MNPSAHPRAVWNLAFALLAFACGAEPESATETPVAPTRAAALEPAGQVRDLASPDGRLRVVVAIESQRGREFSTYWVPEIRDARGETLLRDDEG
jgi:hypothetical protein